jgi:hypothetical protein
LKLRLTSGLKTVSISAFGRLMVSLAAQSDNFVKPVNLSTACENTIAEVLNTGCKYGRVFGISYFVVYRVGEEGVLDETIK